MPNKNWFIHPEIQREIRYVNLRYTNSGTTINS